MPFYPTDSRDSTPLQHQQPPICHEYVPINDHGSMRNRPRKLVVIKFDVDGNIGVAEPSQKKRGHPRKSIVDGTGVTGATSSKNPPKKFNIGFLDGWKDRRWIYESHNPCGHWTGKVTLRQSATTGGTMTHEAGMGFSSKAFTLSVAFGQFDIISLSGSFMRLKSGVIGFLNLSVTSPDGSDYGVVLAGKLKAVTPVALRCFSPYVEKPESKAPSSTPPPIF
ncbi:hypothetical protein FXO37_29550 [Capsicum annuum]|nr:hypothetical protein FXO37_29550 [Capsicum annuum]